MRLSQSPINALNAQRGHLFPWSPVCLGIGIGIYFSLAMEPGRAELLGVLGAALALCVCAIFIPGNLRPFAVAAVLVLLGVVIAALRANTVAAPKLEYRYYGPVEGRVVVVDRSQSDAPRLTLDRVRLDDMAPDETPRRVRVSLHGMINGAIPKPGQIIGTTAHLSPPAGPVEPGGFDFQRQAWFQKLGAVGYTRVPVVILAPAEVDGLGVAVARLRYRLSAAVREALPGPSGSFAAAITTGDRSGIPRETLNDLRAANLAHLLAISGLHMGLLTGFVFWAARSLLAACGVALRHPVKKIAACLALAAGAVYLALSGGNVATERAFVMVAVMFLAVLVNRRAVTIRAVAVAALIVLALRPETMFGPGFQMSFAATVALVATYRWMRDRDWSVSRWPAPVRLLGGVALSSAVAGMATAPFAAAHFNMVPHYGLIANILSVPMMGLVVMPSAVLAALLAPFGLAWIALGAMKWPILWILAVAEQASSWPGSVSHVVAPGPLILPLLAVGGLWVALWRGWTRGLGFAVLAGGFLVWSQTERPVVLIADTGGLVGVMTEAGRALSKPKGDGFSARSWLENDGDSVEQSAAFERVAFLAEDDIKTLRLGELRLVHATGKRASAEAISRCAEVDIVVVNNGSASAEGCLVIDPAHLTETGSLAIYSRRDGSVRIVAARQVQGARLWSQ